jgi:hypothetical protein
MWTCEIQRETVPCSHKFMTVVEYIYLLDATYYFIVLLIGSTWFGLLFFNYHHDARSNKHHIYLCPLSGAHLIYTPFREVDLLPYSGGLCNDDRFFIWKISGDDWYRRRLGRLVVRVLGQY